MKTLDTRDLNNRKIELEALRDALDEAKLAVETMSADIGADSQTLTALEMAKLDFSTDEAEELAELETLESEISEWQHGETLIPESDFEDYARELAEDCGMISGSGGWPLNCIDWEKAARELAYDYTIVTYQGKDYYVRD